MFRQSGVSYHYSNRNGQKDQSFSVSVRESVTVWETEVLTVSITCPLRPV